MAKRSTDKGKAGERELVNVANEHDLDAVRLAPLQAGRFPGAPDVLIRTWPELHVEVKRDERMSVDAMVRQAARDAAAYPGEAREPVVAWRRNGTGRRGWRIDCRADHYFGLLDELHRLRAWADRVEATHPHLTSPESATHTTPEDR